MPHRPSTAPRTTRPFGAGLVLGGPSLAVTGLVVGGLAGFIAGPFALGAARPGWGAALIGSGLLLTVAGVLSALDLIAAKALPAVVAAALGAITVALVAGDRAEDVGPAEHGHQHAAGADHQISAEIDTVLRRSGARAALDRVDALAPALGSAGLHQYVHELGRRAFGYTGGDVAAAFNGCDGRYEGSCYHGVLQAYFAADPRRVTADVTSLCEGVIVPADAPPRLAYDCRHGLGHGFAVAFAPDVAPALIRCDGFVAEDHRSDCRRGVFMDHVVSTGGHLDYSCSAQDARHQADCYGLQSAASLQQNGHDIPAAFAACDKVPPEHIPDCYLGMGRDISGISGGDAEQAHQLCGLGDPAYQFWCTTGTVAQLVSADLSADRALAYCARAAAGRARSCFEVVGEHVVVLHADPAEQTAECAKASGPAGAGACRRGAGLP